jgi:hypothetical protein
VNERKIELAIVALAIFVRIAAVFALRSYEIPRSAYEHGEIASNLLTGRGFSIEFLGAFGPTSQQAPVYPFIVAAAYAIGGIGTPRSHLILELAQSGLGGVLAFAVIRLAREIAPERKAFARLAGLIVAVHPTLVYAATHVQVAGLNAVLLASTLAAGYAAARTRRTRDAIGAGALLALLALADPILALSSVSLAWISLRSRPLKTSVRLLGIEMLVFAIGLAPWTIRNALVHGEFVAVKSTFGYAFWQGNCRLSEGTDKVVRRRTEGAVQQAARAGFDLAEVNRSLWKARHIAGYLDDIALSREDKKELGMLSEPERSRVLFRRAVVDLKSEPWRYPRLCLRRLRYFFLFDETNPKSRSVIYRAGHLALTIAAVLGLMFTPRSVRRSLAPTLLAAALIALFHALTIVSARFHIPIEPLMAIWAAAPIGRERSNLI